MSTLDADTIDELTWRVSAAIGASIPTILRPHLEDSDRILVAVLVSRTGLQVQLARYAGAPVGILLQWDDAGELDIHQPCFYCARPATHRDMLTHNQVCGNCAAGQSHHEPL